VDHLAAIASVSRTENALKMLASLLAAKFRVLDCLFHGLGRRKNGPARLLLRFACYYSQRVEEDFWNELYLSPCSFGQVLSTFRTS
jgi:hypothetical protein